jgi:RND family efflux transporter MFP subunit
MAAPEIEAQLAEAEARIAVVEAEQIAAEANLAAVESTFARLTEAAKTPGVVAGNDVVLAEKKVDVERARLVGLERTITAHQATLRVIEETERYLRVTAPFDGVITERNVHVGTLAGPSADAGASLFRLQQTHLLRLEAAVPEAYTESITSDREVRFSVPAYPGEMFVGVVARPAYSVDPRTRTMPVELDVDNADGRLLPGMYAEVSWPIRREAASLFVPASAIKSTTERIFVIRVRNGIAEWVDVRRGMTEGNLVEVFSADLASGDRIVLRATDEIRPGVAVQPAGSQ